jgi:putative membrane protein
MKNRALIWLSVLFLTLFAYITVLRPLLEPWVALPQVPGGHRVNTPLFLLFSLCHALYLLGWRHTLIFFALSAVISWGFEQVGVATGAIYGPYHYTEMLGFRLGHVPLLIPMAWFMMIYPAYVLANLIADGQPSGSRDGVVRVGWLALLSAMIMTAWDVVMDPFMSGETMRAWVWEENGVYFGVPLQNFVGWLLTTFTVYAVYRLVERWSQPRAAGPLTPMIVLLPLLGYSLMMIPYVLSPDAGPLRVVAAFAMGLPVAAAAGRIGGGAGAAPEPGRNTGSDR